MKAICMICLEHYANVDLETLRYPLTGAMFQSPDLIHGTPAPFDASLTWGDNEARYPGHCCPYGRIHMAFINTDLIKTDQGMIRLPKDGGAAFLDPKATGEIDRSSIGDRVIQVSDEEAERQARAGTTTTKVFVGDNPTTQEDIALREDILSKAENPVPAVLGGEKGVVVDVSIIFTCPTCGKEFAEEKKFKGHIIGAHKRRKKK